MMTPRQNSTERRSDPRLWCAELVSVQFKDSRGRKRKVVANLEDISTSGAGVQLSRPIPANTRVTVQSTSRVYRAVTAWCRRQPDGYHAGLKFTKESKWSLAQ